MTRYAECTKCKQLKKFDTPKAQLDWAMRHVNRDHQVFAYSKEEAA